ncbi:MAG: hypothetical protein ACM31E_11210 [Fibrobacterota bacterium]
MLAAKAFLSSGDQAITAGTWILQQKVSSADKLTKKMYQSLLSGIWEQHCEGKV